MVSLSSSDKRRTKRSEIVRILEYTGRHDTTRCVLPKEEQEEGTAMIHPSKKTDPSSPPLLMWTCPTCGRKFHRSKQPHVCDTTTVEDHLRGKDPAVVALFHTFAQAVGDAGPYEYAPIKAQVGFQGHRRIFAGVSLTKRGLEGYLDLPRRVDSSRFRNIAPYTRRLFVHHFVLTSADQLDAEFLGWIQEASQVGQGLPTR